MFRKIPRLSYDTIFRKTESFKKKEKNKRIYDAQLQKKKKETERVDEAQLQLTAWIKNHKNYVAHAIWENNVEDVFDCSFV